MLASRWGLSRSSLKRLDRSRGVGLDEQERRDLLPGATIFHGSDEKNEYGDEGVRDGEKPEHGY